MTKTVSQEARQVVVTQADRDAMVSYENARPIPLNPEFAGAVLKGGFDYEPRVQAFARHRQSAERETLARAAHAQGEPVGWMYSRDKDTFPPSITAMRQDPESFAAMARNGWTETPLYAHPQPSADLVEALRLAVAYIDAIPRDVVSALPVMPGFDRDFVESALAKAGAA